MVQFSPNLCLDTAVEIERLSLSHAEAKVREARRAGHITIYEESDALALAMLHYAVAVRALRHAFGRRATVRGAA